MIELGIKEITDIIKGKLVTDIPDGMICGFSTDSRTINKGEFFLAIQGKNHDGHKFIDEAAKKGAGGFIVSDEKSVTALNGDKHVILVEDVIRTLADISREIRKRIKATVIAITGSNGKTTVKDLLAHVLSSKYKLVSSRRSFNNVIGVGLTLFDVRNDHEIVILELGTNHPGEMSILGDIVRPDVVIITNIGQSHIEFFGNKEGVFKEKIELLKFLKRGGGIFLNGDDPFLQGIQSDRGDVNYYGSSKNCDFIIKDIEGVNEGYVFYVNENEYIFPQKGIHNVYNVTVAIAVAQSLGVGDEKIRERVKNVSMPPMRLERIKTCERYFINDAYNSNPESFECALNVLENSECSGERVVIAGDMLELGAESESLHRAIGKSVARRKINKLIVLGSWANSTIEGALEEGMSSDNVIRADGCEHASEIIRKRTVKESLILLKASRAAKLEEIIKCFTTYSTP
ncbi:MAG: UDP-N-acetylmuramoyl-tripeptide--D-alanyl-D-alanine ligase [Candidatus Aadella gelida]|nr:UDP-N-acetylmuramoyl-tripeptide--D-alanyl-D-alanine ligase [Candidatus Aadella gelida]